MSEEFLCIQEVPTCRNRAGRSEARVELRVLRQRAEPGTSPDLLAAVSLGSTGQDWGSLREKVIGFSCRDFASYPDVVPVPILGPSLLFCGKPACWIRGSNPQDKVKPLPPSPPLLAGPPEVQSQGGCGCHKEPGRSPICIFIWSCIQHV